MAHIIYTFGYAGLSIESSLSILRGHSIRQLADVRRFPNSKTNPDFNQGIVRRKVEAYGMTYRWMGEALGGYRDGGYPAYMKSAIFSAGLKE